MTRRIVYLAVDCARCPARANPAQPPERVEVDCARGGML
jgi:hypothetical protein